MRRLTSHQLQPVVAEYFAQPHTLKGNTYQVLAGHQGCCSPLTIPIRNNTSFDADIRVSSHTDFMHIPDVSVFKAHCTILFFTRNSWNFPLPGGKCYVG